MRYLLYLPNPETVTYAECETAGRIWLGRNPLEKFFCLHRKNGRWIDCGMYLWRLEMGRKQVGVEYKENDTDFVPELLVA